MAARVWRVTSQAPECDLRDVCSTTHTPDRFKHSLSVVVYDEPGGGGSNSQRPEDTRELGQDITYIQNRSHSSRSAGHRMEWSVSVIVVRRLMNRYRYNHRRL